MKRTANIFNNSMTTELINGENLFLEKTLNLMARLPEREQERFYSRMEGFFDGMDYATSKRELTSSVSENMAATNKYNLA